MSTCRVAITDALRALGVIAPGSAPTIDELDEGLNATTALLRELHNARGPMLDLDVIGDYTPGENQRLRVQAGVQATISLPNSVLTTRGYYPYDYGFTASYSDQSGSLSPADGVNYRPIRDGSRVEIVGVTEGLYFYRSDTNQWLPAYGLAFDSELPISGSYDFAARLAERLIDVFGGQITPSLARRIARANTAFLLRPNVEREPINWERYRATYGGTVGVPSGVVPGSTPGTLDFSDPANSGLTVVL